MTKAGARLLGAAALLSVSAAAEPARPRVYTNEDLDRVSPRRGETGVDSRPGAEPAAPSRTTDAPSDSARAREAHWRREADRLRDRLQPLRDRADDLREQMDGRSRTPGVKPVTDPRLLALARRLAAVEARIRDAELQFEERARRAGALPGWLR
jgi:hypothetical protein